MWICVAVNALGCEYCVKACRSLASCVIFARDWSVRNTAIFCDYNIPPSPLGVETTAQNRVRHYDRTSPRFTHFPTKPARKKGKNSWTGKRNHKQIQHFTLWFFPISCVTLRDGLQVVLLQCIDPIGEDLDLAIQVDMGLSSRRQIAGRSEVSTNTNRYYYTIHV